MLRLVMLAGLLSAVDLNAQLDVLLKELSPKDARVLGWSWRLTPALPAEWPPKGSEGPVVQYAYAAGMDLSVRDGERNSAPFARVEHAVDGAVKVVQLTKSLEQPQIQGVRPISRDEAALQSGDLLAPARAGQLSSLRVPWCTWKKYHGVVAQHLVAKHPAFFAALACESAK